MSPDTRDLRPLEAALGLTFRNPDLLRQALTHRSYVHEHPETGGETNERFEFLGDAILHFVAADELFHRYPEAPEGRLTTLRAALVSTVSLAAIAESLHLDRYVRVSRGEATLEGRGRRSILADALEAVLAAVYLDAGLETAHALARQLLRQRMEEALRLSEENVKGRLQEVVQATQGVTPFYRVVERAGPEHAEQFVVEVVAGNRVLGRGQGLGKRQAERAAARRALASLGVPLAPSDTPAAGELALAEEDGPPESPTTADTAARDGPESRPDSPGAPAGA
jgi:ribonuclease-3